jgi:YD repeat-containing protein
MVGGVAYAQTTPEDEYKNLIKVNEDIQPLGDAPFGEDVNLYTGELSFHEKDVDLKGNGPDIIIQRDFTAGKYGEVGLNSITRSGEFGDWSLALPRISTLDTTTLVWPGIDPRCSAMSGAPPVIGPRGIPYSSEDWWNGYQLITPDAGQQELLLRGSNNSQVPTGSVVPAVTKQHWVVECVASTNNGLSGEGFLVIAPDGTKYTLNQLVYDPWYPVGKSLGTGPSGKPVADSIERRVASMLVTRVEDRFGNWVTYNYNGTGKQLASIQASDGRQVSFSWRGDANLISSISITTAAGSRTWSYDYSNPTDATHVSLSSVTLPDASQWKFDLSALAGASYSEIYEHGNISTGCQASLVQTEAAPTFTGTMTQPSGLQGTFTTQPMQHGRSWVPNTCHNSEGVQYLVEPASYYTITVTAKTFNGSGVRSTWNYEYSSSNASLRDPCTTTPCQAPTCTVSSSQNCLTTVYADVITPDGVRNRYAYSNLFGYTEGQLQRIDYNYGGAPSKAELHTYANPSAGPYPDPVGSVFGVRDDTDSLQRIAPENSVAIQQDGDTYTWQAESFDAYAQATQTKRFNSIAGQQPLEESTAYLNDTNTWVLGLPQTVTNVATGEVESSNTYNGLDELTARARFGQALMSYTWNSAGQLASFTDGNSHTTSLSSYVRGVPTAIAYPDGTGMSLAVDDFGQITAITDQAGHTTHYGYDPVGRIASISYPYDSSIDSASWYAKTFAYSYVTAAERGVAAGHWRRTTTQGSAVDTTYFDAELRPVLDDSANGSADISTATGYDWRGLTTFDSYPVNGSPDLAAVTAGTHSSYDALGRLTQVQQDSELGALSTATAYLSGARKQVTDPKGNVTTTTYQAFDQPAYDAPIQVQAPAGITQAVGRDVYGNPLSITQSGSYGSEADSVTKTLVYDGYHRLCRTTEPETGSTVLAYDGANNLAWSAEGLSISESGCGQDQVATAARTARSYDAMNRVLTLAPPSGTQSTAYTYDALGRVTQAVSGISTRTYAYNSLGLPTQETLQVDGYSWTLGHGYDAYGHPSSTTYPAPTGAGETVAYAPDAWGRPTQAGSYATAVSYFPNGQVAGFTQGNGASYVVEQNARQLTRNFTYGAGTALALSEDRSFDANGNLTQATDLVDGTRSKTFGYDALNRLTSAQAPNLYGTESYAYDPLNNLRSRLSGGGTESYNYDASNKLASITQGASTLDSYGYDSQGNTILQNGVPLAYDAKHQLTGITGYGSYAYDADGRRVEKQAPDGSVTAYYFYDQAGQLAYQYAPQTHLSTDYIYLGTKLVAHNEEVNSQIVGNIDGITIDASGNAVLTGWACSTNLAQSINVDLYVGGPAGSGTGIGRYTANLPSESAVATQCKVSSGNYRFQIPITAAMRSQYVGQAIYVHGISPVGNDNSLLAQSGIYTVPAPANAPAPPATAPALSVPATSATGSYTVSWGNVSTATSYTLQQSINGGGWSTVYSGSATSQAVNGEGNGTYAYQVRACNAGGCGAWSATATTVVTHPPASAPSLTVPATSATGSYTVSWSAVSGATNYTLQQSVNGGGWSTAYSGSGTNQSFNLADGTYTYQIQACNAGGCGPWSAGQTIVVSHVPAVPTNVVQRLVSNGKVVQETLSWDAVSGASSYEVENGSTGAIVYQGTATTVTVSSWAAHGGTPDSFPAAVRACNAYGCSAWGTVQ